MHTFTETNVVVSGLPMTIIRSLKMPSMAILNCSSSESPWMYGMVSTSSPSPCAVTRRSLLLSSGIVSSSSLYQIYCSIFFSLCLLVSLSTNSGISSFPSSAELTIWWWFIVFIATCCPSK